MAKPTRRVWTDFRIWLVLLVAWGIELFRLDARTFHGDELGSISEALQPGLNANSLPYSLVLRVWLLGGQGEFWLRFLSAILIVAAVAVTFRWVKELTTHQTALLVACLLATSPFLIVYGQQVRFYALSLLAASVCIAAFVRLLENKNRRTITLWLVTDIVAGLALVLNGLLVLGQIATGFVLSHRPSLRTKIVVVMVSILVSAIILAIPIVRQTLFDALATYMNAESRYTISRGFSLSQALKIPLTYFFFIFGESVYPLTYGLVLPGTLLFGALSLFGLYRLWAVRLAFWTVVTISGLGLVLLYLVFDSLVPPTLQGAAPRYLIFLLPLFYLTVAEGARLSRKSWLMIPLLGVNVLSLGFYWYGDWAYTDDLVDWRAITREVGDQRDANTLVLVDGRASSLAKVYFPSSWAVRTIWTQQNDLPPDEVNDYSRLIVVSATYRADQREENNALLDRLDAYRLVSGWSKYPVFVYAYERQSSSPQTVQMAKRNTPVMPVDLYGLEFQDLRLPINIGLNQRGFDVLGAFSLPRLNGETSTTIRMAEPVRARKIVLLSNLVGNVQEGTPIATLQVPNETGFESISLRAGYETNSWDQGSCKENCRSVYEWRKRIALAGRQAYPEAWREFTAHIFESEITLDTPRTIRSLQLERVDTRATLYVWGLQVEP